MATLKWSENWRRAYRVSVGVPETEVTTYTIVDSPVDVSNVKKVDTQTTPSDARQLSNLSEDGADPRGFTFKLDAKHVLSNQGSNGETSYIDLYNLDEDMISVINKDGCLVIVEAGYGDTTELAYSGEKIKVQTFRQGADIVYRIHCKSGAKDMRNTYTSLSYDEDMTLEDVVIDMFNRFPNTTLGKYALANLRTETKTGGRVFTGKLVDNLDKLAEEFDLIYCHYNGKIYIMEYELLGENYGVFSNTIFNLSADTIKKVSDISDNQGEGVQGNKSKLKKLQVNTFFIPIEIGQFITIPETDYTKDTYGTYQVRGKRLILESKGSAWDVVLEVEQLQQ